MVSWRPLYTTPECLGLYSSLLAGSNVGALKLDSRTMLWGTCSISAVGDREANGVESSATP